MCKDKIKFFIMDVDGTLTDGKIYISDTGECMKAFSVKDGYGIRDLLPQNDIIPIIITGRCSKIVQRRSQELNIIHVYQKVENKLEILNYVLEDISKKNVENYDLNNVAYMGDDMNDLPCIEAVKNAGGLTGCPIDAIEKIKEECQFVSRHEGGCGAVREFIDFIIRSNGRDR